MANSPGKFLDRLQDKYPSGYPDGLVRTVQRWMKIWRADRAHDLIFGSFADQQSQAAPAEPRQ